MSIGQVLYHPIYGKIVVTRKAYSPITNSIAWYAQDRYGVERVLDGSESDVAPVEATKVESNPFESVTMIKGKKGDKGEPGRTPIAGIDYYSKAQVEKLVQNLAEQLLPKLKDSGAALRRELVAMIPILKDGKDGKTPVKGKDYFTRKETELFVETIFTKVAKLVKDGKDGQSPKHRWKGTKLQFQNPDGTWGDAVDLKGLDGLNGLNGGGGGIHEIKHATDVAISSPTNGQALTYNSTTKKWENGAAVGGGGTWGSITGTLSNQTDLQSALDAKLAANTPITGATKTKITYDNDGLVTAGADATTADIAASTDKNYVTDAQLTVIGNTSGTNTGDQNLFANVAVSGQNTVAADSTTDTLTLVAGTNVTITTDATTDSVTINASGGGTPGGSDTQVQFNDGGSAFGGDAGLTYNKTTDTLTVPNVTGSAASGLTLTSPDATTPVGVTVTAGSATSGDNDGSNVHLAAGAGSGTGVGGDIVGYAGNSDSSDGGGFSFAAGNANTVGAGGNFTLQGGAGGSVSGGDGGYLNLVGGAGRSSNASGGNILLQPGNKNGSGTAGVLKVSNPTNGIYAVLQTSSIATSNKTFTFPNNTGTFALLEAGQTFTADISVPADAYGAGWNGSNEVPTKNDIYDKIETISAGSGITRTVTVTSGNYTAGSSSSTDYVYLIAGAHTTTLPTASGNSNRYTFKNNHSVNVTINRDGTDTIEGATSLTLGVAEAVDLISDGTSNWNVI